jgi:hypothetical protein
LEKAPPPQRGGIISQCHLGEKYEAGKRKGGNNVGERGKGERKRNKGGKERKIGNKRVY